MSSKLHRGGISSEPVAWRRAALAGVLSSGVGANAPDERHPSYEEGFEAGLAAGRQEKSAEMEAMRGQLARTIEELTGLRGRFRHEAEEDAVALALAIARRILHRELTVDPEALLGVVKAGFEKIELREVHRVRVSREDAAVVEQYLKKIGSPHRIEVIADAGLKRGAALLESSRGTLDASIETQLAEIERGFADLVRHA
jgi:flagellar assembly protein FliH